MVVFIRDSSKVPTFDAGHDASSSPPRFPGTVTRTPHPHSPSIPPSRQRVEKPRSKPRARPPPTLRNRVSDRNIDLVLALHFCELWSSLTQWWWGGRGDTVRHRWHRFGWCVDGRAVPLSLPRKIDEERSRSRSTLLRVEKRWWAFVKFLWIWKVDDLKKRIYWKSYFYWRNMKQKNAILIFVLKIWDRRVVNI